MALVWIRQLSHTGPTALTQGLQRSWYGPALCLNAPHQRLCAVWNWAERAVHPFASDSTTHSSWWSSCRRQYTTIETANQGDAEVKEERTKPNKPARKNARWSEEELKLLQKFLRQNKPIWEVGVHFPDRTLGGIKMRMSTLRIQGRTAAAEAERLWPTKKPWTAEEDQRLVDLIQRHQDKVNPWPWIATDVVDGQRLGRTPVSCRRRWEIINPSSVRRRGRWSQDEKDRLVKAIYEQLDMAKPANENKKKAPSRTISSMDKELLSTISWREISKAVETRSDVQCRSHTFGALLSGRRGRWTKGEEDLLEKAVAQHGRDFEKLRGAVQTRSTVQIKRVLRRMDASQGSN